LLLVKKFIKFEKEIRNLEKEKFNKKDQKRREKLDDKFNCYK
jgi:hypothetical protein